MPLQHCGHAQREQRSVSTAPNWQDYLERVLAGEIPSDTSFFFFFSHTSTFQLLDKPWSQVGVVPSPPRFSPSFFIAHRVQQSHCSSIFHRVLLTHALAFYASQFVRKKKSPRIYPSMHSGGFEFTKLTYTRLEDNLIRHRGDRLTYTIYVWPP